MCSTTERPRPQSEVCFAMHTCHMHMHMSFFCVYHFCFVLIDFVSKKHDRCHLSVLHMYMCMHMCTCMHVFLSSCQHNPRTGDRAASAAA